ncbi:MAG TPA: tetratricopeptide repeat protein, partial [Terriglobales bacterium]|nr:tetratricopeptide repeat protein [Terriglobales bacterium]
AADKGLATAQFNLGSCYELGQGVVQDLTVAAQWYRRAALQGHSEAQNDLGMLYEEGRGVTQDVMEALKLYLLAAQNGNPKALINLSNVFRSGRGVQADPVQAYTWLEAAAMRGEDVGEALDAQARALTPPQVKQAQQRAAEWLAQQHFNSVPMFR